MAAKKQHKYRGKGGDDENEDKARIGGHTQKG